MRSWTGRFLSHTGRLQLINSVITSMTNFWLQAFSLPSSCMKEIESLCSTFLWSGLELQSSKAKVCWKDLCLPKNEEGLGIRPLKEMNIVFCLKLIWRISSARESLWVKWIHCYLIRKGSFWSVNGSTNFGSWVWRKLLKHRDLAKQFIKKEIGNGSHTSFWYDNWSKHGCLKDALGDRGLIDLGITDNALVSEVLGRRRRRRRHRISILNEVENDIEMLRLTETHGDDITLWKQADRKFTNRFSAKKTWEQIRHCHQTCSWNRGVWFTHSTPNFSFLVWIAVRNRLQTGDKMRLWNAGINTTCPLCNEAEKTREHLFFSCRYSKQVWKILAEGLLQARFTTDWNELIAIITSPGLTPTKNFLVRYAFQAAVNSVWRERNARRHGEQAKEAQFLAKFVDKSVRLWLLSLQGRGKLSEGLMTWFDTRVEP